MPKKAKSKGEKNGYKKAEEVRNDIDGPHYVSTRRANVVAAE